MNTSGFLPIQCTMKNNYALLVSHLLEADGRLGRKTGRDGNTLIFFAYEVRAYNIIQNLLTIDKSCVLDQNSFRNTVLYQATKSLLAFFNLLVGELKKALDPFSTGENIKKVLVNLKNLEGDTVAHLIVKNRVQEMIKVLIEWVGNDIDWTSVNLTGHTPSALALDIIKRTKMHMTIDGCICSNELAIRIRDQPIVARYRQSVLDRICAWSKKNTADDNRLRLQYGVAVMEVFFLISKYFLDNKVRIAARVDDISDIGMVNTVGFFFTLIRTCFILPGRNFSSLISYIGNLCLSYCYVLAVHRASMDEIWPTMLGWFVKFPTILKVLLLLLIGLTMVAVFCFFRH
ncbi:Ankyrin repeat-containing domain containing protein [Trema orientale]|uniref:Ankyrin repeat-containing domain containing protein n=1 Tax=Trema orientale TaxID=63057 RepID=A0A2P5FX35_TREOI|nr:Ankyrin repeat-containing domain containing protein [Trema orientale]